MIAEKKNEVLYIEAKGNTSSMSPSKRFGMPFTNNQIKTHIASAILASMKVASSKPAQEKTRVAIALPDTDAHRKIIRLIKEGLATLAIQVFWVSKDGVRLD